MVYLTLFCIFGVIMELYHLMFRDKITLLFYRQREISNFTTAIRNLNIYMIGLDMAMTKAKGSNNVYVKNAAESLNDTFRTLWSSNASMHQIIENSLIMSGGYIDNLKTYLWKKTFTPDQTRFIYITAVVELGYVATIIGIIYQLHKMGFQSAAWAFGIAMLAISAVSAWNGNAERLKSRNWAYADVAMCIFMYLYIFCAFCFPYFFFGS